MGTLSYDFESDTTGSPPDGWAYETGDATDWTVKDVSGDNVFGPAVDSGRSYWQCSDAGSVDDVIVTGRYRFLTDGTKAKGGVFLRQSGSSGRNGYLFDLIPGVGIAIYEYSNNAFVRTVAAYTGLSFAADTWYEFRVEATGTTLRAWAGASGVAWPGIWLLTSTDDSHTSGRVCLASTPDNITDNDGVEFDNLTITSDEITVDVVVAQDPIGAASIAGYDPTVAITSSNINVMQDPIGVAVVAGYDPHVSSQGIVVQSGTGNINYNKDRQHTVKISVNVTQSAVGEVEIAGYDPVVGFPTNVAPIGNINIAGYNPTVAASASKVRLFFKFKDENGFVWTREIDAHPPVTAVSATYIASSTEETILADATAGAFDVTMPTVTGRDGYEYTIKKVDSSANAVTVKGTIDGDTDFILEFQHESITIAANSSGWWIK